MANPIETLPDMLKKASALALGAVVLGLTIAGATAFWPLKSDDELLQQLTRSRQTLMDIATRAERDGVDLISADDGRAQRSLQPSELASYRARLKEAEVRWISRWGQPEDAHSGLWLFPISTPLLARGQGFLFQSVTRAPPCHTTTYRPWSPGSRVTVRAVDCNWYLVRY